MKLKIPDTLNKVLNKKYLPIYLLIVGVLVFGGVTISQLRIDNKSTKSETTTQQKDLSDNNETESGEVAGAQDNKTEINDSPTISTKPKVNTPTPTNTPEVKSNSNEQGEKNSSTTIVIVTATPFPTYMPTPYPTVSNNADSNQNYIPPQKDCTVYRDHLSYLEQEKQKAVDQATAAAQAECVKRGYSPPDYGSCSGLIDQRVSEVTPTWDLQISSWKLQADPYGECD